MDTLQPVILAGGAGTRLWPLSLPERPKPFARILGERTMFQETVLRSNRLAGTRPPIVVCAVDHYPEVSAQLAATSTPGRIVLEPIGRNTAPALATAALLSQPNDLLLALPADHAIKDQAAFAQAVGRARAAARDGRLTTFGIVPDRPETGYGYIERGDPLPGLDGVASIASFREKPDYHTAVRFLESGRYSWNSGMFLVRADVYLKELRAADSEMARCVSTALGSIKDQNPVSLDESAFRACPPGSIDRTVMERTKQGAVVPLKAGWSDLGSWAALWERAERDRQDNVVVGNVATRDVTNSYINAGTRPVLVLGLDRVVVVDSEEGLLVAAIDRAQEIKPPE